MTENDVYTAAFNEEFRQEFVNCVNVLDFIVALGNVLTNSDEEQIKAVWNTQGNISAATFLCERLCRRQNWKERILKALGSDNISQYQLAEKIDKKFREIEAGTKSNMPKPKGGKTSGSRTANARSNTNMDLVFGAAAGVAIALAVPYLLGFTAAGIAAGSIAARLMSAAAIANGGGVAAGGVVATLQSIGAAGLGVRGVAIAGSLGAAIARGARYLARPDDNDDENTDDKDE